MSTHLRRELGLAETVSYGIGIIIGAGVYALIGIGAGLTGHMLWFAFLITGILALCTAWSYANLCKLYPKEAAEYNFSIHAFGIRPFAFIVEWMFLIAMIVFSSVVARGFANYFSELFGTPVEITAIVAIIILTLVNSFGIKRASLINDICNLATILGLLLIILLVFSSPKSDIMPVITDFSFPLGITGLLSAVSVMFFAYVGFETIANISEEVKDSRKNVPLAILISVAISMAFYIAVAIAALSVATSVELAASKAPLSLVFERAFGSHPEIFSIIAIFATANTILLALFTASRILFGLGRAGRLPKGFASLNTSGSPNLAVCAVGVGAILAIIAFDLKQAAQFADLIAFFTYSVINLSFLAIAFRANGPKFSLVPGLIGLIGSLGMFVFAFLEMPFLVLLVAGIGVLVYMFMPSQHRHSRR